MSDCNSPRPVRWFRWLRSEERPTMHQKHPRCEKKLDTLQLLPCLPLSLQKLCIRLFRCKLLIFRIILERIVPPAQTEAMRITALLIIGMMRRTEIFDIHFHSNQNTILTFLTKIISTFYRIGRWWRFPVVTRTFFTSRTNRVWNHCCWWRNILSIKKIHIIGVRARDCRTMQVRSHSHRFQLQQEGKNTPVQDFLESGTRWHCTQDSRTTWLISTLCPTISHTIGLKPRISNSQKNSYSLFLSKPLIRDEPTDFAGNRRRNKTSFRNSWWSGFYPWDRWVFVSK